VATKTPQRGVLAGPVPVFMHYMFLYDEFMSQKIVTIVSQKGTDLHTQGAQAGWPRSLRSRGTGILIMSKTSSLYEDETRCHLLLPRLNRIEGHRACMNKVSAQGGAACVGCRVTTVYRKGGLYVKQD
jgi:hypothetical protein